MKTELIIESLLTIAPTVAKALQTYFGDKKNIKPAELQTFYLATIIEGNAKVESLLSDMQKLLKNHMEHETKIWQEVLQSYRDLRADMTRKGVI